MLIKNFYNYFHSTATLQTKVISKNNFTYYLIIKKLEKIIKNDKKITIFNFGCGVGTIDLYLAKKGCQIQGFDVSLKAIQIANKNAKKLNLSKQAHFFTNNEKRLKQIKSKFDLVICSEVLEHIKNDKKTLLSLKNLLKKNGKIFITVPSKNAPLFRLGFTKKFDKKVGHLRRYSVEEIKETVIKAGFDILEVHKSEGILRNSFFLFNPLNRLVKYIKGPLSPIVNYLDWLTVLIFGESDIIILAQKK